MSLAGKRVLYVSYNGMLDPLGQSQVIPYLKELSKLGVRFWLVSFERAHAFDQGGIEAGRSLREELSRHGIEWHALRYHQKPSIPATAYDVAAGIRFAGRLMKKHKIDMVHARAQIPAVIALALKRRFGAKVIFDVRGLMAEEYIDAEHWKAGGVPARLTKAMEARVLRSAEGVVTLTDVLWNAMQGWPSVAQGRSIHKTIPCCVDLERFRFDDEERATRRAELGIKDRFVLVYSGSIGSWYLTEEMAAFFAQLKQKINNAFFLWLTQGPPSIVSDAMQKCGIGTTDYAVRAILPTDVPGFLSAADAGIAFYRPGISRLGTSPVKVSEYLACGLPVVINTGLGDSDRLVTERKAGALVRNFSDADYAEAATLIVNLTGDPEQTSRLSRGIAEEFFDLRQVGARRYAELYEKVFSGGP